MVYLWILQIEALKAVGVTEVVLAINYQPEVCEVFPCVRYVKLIFERLVARFL